MRWVLKGGGGRGGGLHSPGSPGCLVLRGLSCRVAIRQSAVVLGLLLGGSCISYKAMHNKDTLYIKHYIIRTLCI